ncbi:hypothetical protein [Azospirillum picis]|uniref:Uncharacterized protein n=1 Tax=Azospirillum picis TaxID=488438 RepID=A0ABU0MEC6_9PROT|nr:hypothetical protein [Azospirillum picis]MBP2297952.1 hypothetical protein [Azospirillum picis]MDQ0531790.1 hypothetical protein [Azospirillum picis]
MLPVSTKNVITFTPLRDQIETLTGLQARAETPELAEGFARLIDAVQAQLDANPDQPVFRLAVPSHFQRASFRRDLRAAGATYPGDAELYRALREDLREVNPYNLDTLLELIDEVEASAQGDVDPDALDGLEAITRLARAAGGRYAAMEGDREFWLSVAPIVACQHFLLGWEGVKAKDGSAAPFVRRRDLTTDETLSHLDEDELRAVGFKIMGLMRPSKDQEKNFVSPSRSASSRKPTKTASKSLPAKRDGSSSASISAETPVSI